MKPPPANSLVNRIIAMILTLLVLSGTLGLGAVWMRQEISQTANRSRAYEGQITDVERRLDEVNAQVAAALNPDALLRQNQFMTLTLATPRELQVVRVSESAELRLATKRNREVFNLSAASTEGAPRPAAFRVVTAALH